MRMPRRLTLGLAICLLAVPLHRAAPQEASSARTAAAADDYPSAEFNLKHQYTAAQIAAQRRRLAGQPGPVADQFVARHGRRLERQRALLAVLQRDPDQFLSLVGEPWTLVRGIDYEPFPPEEQLPALIAALRQRQGTVSRETAARLELTALRMEAARSREDRAYAAAIERFITMFEGTETAALARVYLIQSPNQAGKPALYDAFVSRYPGTAAAANALFQKGFHRTQPTFPRDDIFARFQDVSTVVAQLRSGAYPPGEWVDRAHELLRDFRTYGGDLTVEHADAMLAAYRQLAAEWMSRDDVGDGDIAAVVRQIGDLMARRGDGPGGIERAFDALDAVHPPRTRLMKAEYYLRYAIDEPDEQETATAKARVLLEGLSAGGSRYARRALAVHAAADFFSRNFAAALARYQRFVSQYPTSDYAWVAALRVGRSLDHLGRPQEARRAYERVAATYREGLPAVLAHAFAADAAMATSDWAGAGAAARRALAAWPGEYDHRYELGEGRLDANLTAPVLWQRRDGVTRARLREIVAAADTARTRAGARLVRGERLMDERRWTEAIAAFDEALKGPAEIARQARERRNHARVILGLEAAAADRGVPDLNAALRLFDSVAREPFDFGVGAALIAKASVLWTQQRAAEAEPLMREALVRLQRLQAAATLPRPDALQQDLLAIRDEVFRPTGAPIYATEQWNAFEWPTSLPQFVLVADRMEVTAPSSVDTRPIPLAYPISGVPQAIFITPAQKALLERVITIVGGTRTSQPSQIMEVPNQPVGPSLGILALWSRFFPARQGHWAGWEIYAYPRVSDVTFADLSRTRAAVRVTIGYAGATVFLEKVDGKWRAIRLADQWVT